MFYTIIIKADSQSIFKHETSNEAMEKFHNEMAYAYNQHIATTVMVVDNIGHVLECKVYEEPTVVEEM